MTLRYLAETFGKEYNFRLSLVSGKGFGKYERNELVLLNYEVAECEVVSYKHSETEPNLVYVVIKWDKCDVQA